MRKIAVLMSLLPFGVLHAAETTTFTYDDLGRLISSANSGGPRNGNASQEQYDPAGNRAAVSVGLPLPPPNNAAVFSISGSGPVNEGQTATYIITKTGPAGSTLTVNYATVDGSAVAPGDYTPVSGTLSFQAWETIKTINVPTLTDTGAEPAESFSMSLSAPSTGASVATGSAVATITANGAANQPPVAVADGAGTIAVCTAKQINVTANDSDPDGNYPLSVVSVTSNAQIDSLIVSGSDVQLSSTGPGGSGQVTYTVQDGLGATASATISYTISGNGCARIGGGQ